MLLPQHSLHVAADSLPDRQPPAARESRPSVQPAEPAMQDPSARQGLRAVSEQLSSSPPVRLLPPLPPPGCGFTNAQRMCLRHQIMMFRRVKV